MLINDKVDAVYIPDSPSRIKATDYNQIKNEIQECITEAGLTPTKDVIQLPQALKILTAQSGAEEVAKIEAAGQEQLNAINTAGAQAVQDAQTAANTAAAKATEAADSATEAAGSASAAASSASAASGSASTATTQATNASASAELAQKWATQTTAEVVSGQGYGAKYYADQAADSAASIVQDAEAAAASATAAANSASAAAQSAQEAASSASLADIQNKITNCITKIPQDIKLTLVDGVLTLKAGSRVYNGSGAVTNITADMVLSISNISSSSDYFLFASTNSGNPYIRYFASAEIFSGSAVPTFSGSHCVWYDTSSKQIKHTDDGGSSWNTELSFPLARFSADGTTVTSVKQVFNGFGYIGQTLFALPGVEGLSPNGRNEDGSLKNELMTLDHVVTRDFTWNCADGQYVFVGQYNTATATEATEIISSGELYNYYQQNELPSFHTNSIWHRLDENKVYKTDNDPTWNPISLFAVGRVFNTGADTNVSSLTIGNPVAAVDMSNTSYMSKLGMPSGKKISLSWGATNTEYTAPANGFFYIQGQGNTAGNIYIEVDVYQTGENILYREGRYTANTNILRMTVPVQAGYKLKLRYDNKITNSTQIAFVFAEGEK